MNPSASAILAHIDIEKGHYMSYKNAIKKVTFKLNEADYNSLLKEAENNNKTISEYIRISIKSNNNIMLKQNEHAQERQEHYISLLISLKGEVSRCGNNLNQIARKVNTEHKISDEILALIKNIYIILLDIQTRYQNGFEH